MSKARASVVAFAAAVGLTVTAAGCSKGPTRTEQEPGPARTTGQSQTRNVAALPQVERVNVPVSGDEPFKGPADAPVTVVMFSDFECPFCARVLPVLQELEQTYGSRLRLVWRNLPLPFHPHAQLAAEAAQEALVQGQGAAFWAMHDKLFQNQKALTDKDLEHYAKDVGLDVPRFQAALASHAHAAKVAEDAALGARVGATGTPVFFINGRPLQGSLPALAFKSLIDDELQRVNAMLAAGVRPANVYPTLIAQGQPAAHFQVARPRMSPFDSTVYNVPVTDTDPQDGPPTALVTVVVFGDFECEFTATALTTLAPIQKKYGPDLRLVWKNRPMPFHEHAEAAATLAMLAFDRGKSALFWQASGLLFQNSSALGRPELENYGQQLGLELSDIRTALDSDAYRSKLDADKELSGRISFGATTPMFTINGRFIKGAQAAKAYELLIDEELAKARARVASGVGREKVYDDLVRDGKVAPFEVAPGTLGADAKKVHNVSLPPKAARRGAENPKVVIQEFGDFECPFCRAVQPTLLALLEENKDSVQLVWRNDPLAAHPHAMLAAQAAQEVLAHSGEKKFWAFHDLLFQNQNALTRADLEGYASKLGVDMVKFREALDSKRHEPVVNADLAALDSVGEQVGTPAFLVNGMLIAGAQPLEIFRVAVQRALLRRNASASAAGKTTRAH